MLMVVPNYIADDLNARLDAAIALVPEAAKDRDALYSSLLEYVNEHGVIPEFSLGKRDTRTSPAAVSEASPGPLSDNRPANNAHIGTDDVERKGSAA